MVSSLLVRVPIYSEHVESFATVSLFLLTSIKDVPVLRYLVPTMGSYLFVLILLGLSIIWTVPFFFFVKFD